ncbi:MAG: hypothetical protein ACMG57_05380 [Candidatus Dojkabacteria bacterium]
MDNNILKQITHINGVTHGDRQAQILLVRKAIEEGKITREEIHFILPTIMYLPFPNDVDSSLWDTLFINEDYLETIPLLMELFTEEDAREMANIFLNIRGSQLHIEIGQKYHKIIATNYLTENEANYILLAFILADFRVNLREERSNY